MKDLLGHTWGWAPEGKSRVGKWRMDECKNCGIIRYGWVVGGLESFKFEWYFDPTPPGCFFIPSRSPGCKKHED